MISSYLLCYAYCSCLLFLVSLERTHCLDLLDQNIYWIVCLSNLKFNPPWCLLNYVGLPYLNFWGPIGGSFSYVLLRIIRLLFNTFYLFRFLETQLSRVLLKVELKSRTVLWLWTRRRTNSEQVVGEPNLGHDTGRSLTELITFCLIMYWLCYVYQFPV